MTGDYECYDIFSPLLNPIINEYHQFNEHSRHVTDLDPGHLKDLDKNLDPTRQYVLSSRIRLSRSVKGVPFPAAASRADLRKVEALAENACEELSDKFKGMYVHLNDMTNEVSEARILEATHLCEQGCEGVMARQRKGPARNDRLKNDRLNSALSESEQSDPFRARFRSSSHEMTCSERAFARSRTRSLVCRTSDRFRTSHRPAPLSPSFTRVRGLVLGVALSSRSCTPTPPLPFPLF